MASAALLRHVADSAPDADLLRRFVQDREPDAFAELVRRHGPVVYRVCRRLLGSSLADDAFQATFLILATRPESVRNAGSVGSWLVGVAGRVARQMRKRERRFLASGGRQPPVSSLQQGADAPRSPELTEQFRILDEELTRLPDRLRGPVVVCLLQGRTQEQAVAELGGSVRTVRRRLEEAKQLLRLRLERRGVVPAVAAGLAAGVGEATAAMPSDLPGRTVSTVFDFLAGGAAVSAPAAVIAKGVAMGTLARKVKLAMVTAAVGLTALGVGVADEKPRSEPATSPPPTAGAVAGDKETVHRTANFVVRSPLPAIARALGNELEHQRVEQAKRWLGRELPAWAEPCRVSLAPHPQSGHVYTGKIELRIKPRVEVRTEIGGTLDLPLVETVPWEVARMVLVTHLGDDLPPWVRAGAIRHAFPTEPHPHRVVHREAYARCFDYLIQGQALRLKAVFEFKGVGQKNGWELCEAEGYAVAKYLLTRGDHPKLVRFIRHGMDNGWDAAAKDVYGFDGVDELERAWLDWMRQNPPPQKESPDPTRIPPLGFAK